MRNVSDKELDELLNGLSTGGIYRLAWTLLKARIGIGLAIAGFAIAVSGVLGLVFGLIFTFWK